MSGWDGFEAARHAPTPQVVQDEPVSDVPHYQAGAPLESGWPTLASPGASYYPHHPFTPIENLPPALPALLPVPVSAQLVWSSAWLPAQPAWTSASVLAAVAAGVGVVSMLGFPAMVNSDLRVALVAVALSLLSMVVGLITLIWTRRPEVAGKWCSILASVSGGFVVMLIGYGLIAFTLSN